MINYFTSLKYLCIVLMLATSQLSAQTNTFTGTQAGNSITAGVQNTFTGYRSGYSNTTGSVNTFSGYNSGYSNTTASYNSFYGRESGYLNTTGYYNTFSGYRSGYTNTSGWGNTFTGYQSGFSTTGSGNTFYGNVSGNLNSTGSYNTYLGYYSNGGSSSSNSTAIGYSSTTTASNQIRIGNTSVTSIGGVAGWTTVSDAKFKKDIQETVPGLEFILKLRPVTYHIDVNAIAEFLHTPDSLRLKDSEREKEIMLQTGFIAQEVEKTADELGYDFSGVDKPKNENDFYGLRYAEFTVPLVKAVQELNAKAEEQEKSLNQKDSIIEDLISANVALNDRLTRLEQLIENNTNASNNSSIQNISECCDASLEQNYPNPFNQTTTIKYAINTEAKTAAIVISSVKGAEIQRYLIEKTKMGQVIIPANSLATGTYFYQLLVDGKITDVKLMEIIK